MSDIHVLTGNGRNKWTAVFHFAVPSANNAVNVNYRTALINSGLGGFSSMPVGVGAGQIAQVELDDIEAGAVFEYSTALLAETGGTSTEELRAMLQGEYAKASTAVLADLQRRLRYFGHTEAGA